VELVQLLTDATEEYNGSTWASNPTGLNTASTLKGGCGTLSSALAFGGQPSITEEWTGGGAVVTKTITVS
jgi:hypothetical protein